MLTCVGNFWSTLSQRDVNPPSCFLAGGENAWTSVFWTNLIEASSFPVPGIRKLPQVTSCHLSHGFLAKLDPGVTSSVHSQHF